MSQPKTTADSDGDMIMMMIYDDYDDDNDDDIDDDGDDNNEPCPHSLLFPEATTFEKSQTITIWSQYIVYRVSRLFYTFEFSNIMAFSHN